MEIVNGALTSIQLLMDISWTAISDCFNYRQILDEKIQTMKTKMEMLIGREVDINTEVREQTHRGGKKQKREVEIWLNRVQHKKSEVQKLEEKAGKRRYLSRLRFLKLVDKATQEVAELTEQGRFPEGLLIDVHQDREMELLAPPLKGQTMRERNIMTIWECLMKDDIHTIGVYGMGGVGKTTILLDIHNKSKESATFDHVYWVTVSQESSIYKLQDGIAQVLNLDLSKETNERRRAATLSKELTGRKKFVLILDDMWEVLAPENVGIPIGGVDGGKLIITTRSLEVCRRMNCQQQIKVEPLSEEEAWDLFKATLQTVLAPEVEAIAKSVAKECAGLPLAIIATAGSMKGVVDIREWRNALKELREPTTKGISYDRENEVFKPLKFSYDRLNDEKLQQCLLYCALFPEDYNIKRAYLITYWIAEGLVDEMETRQAEFDCGHALINKLENACLLERARDREGSVCVKMHDVIRDMALSFTRVNSQFMVKAGAQLTELPAGESDWSENLERVSFMHNKIRFNSSSTSSILISPKCPRLRTLLLQSNYLLREIPHSLFVHMQNLRVLDLSDSNYLERLPDSISDLENLRALLLNGCYRLRYVPSLAKLTKLKDLHLYGISEYAILPDGMGKLVSLKNLALSDNLNTSFWDMVELQVPNGNHHHHLSHHLQSLIYCSVGNDRQLKSLINLRKLEFLFVVFYDLHQFNSYVVKSDGHCQMLTCYYLEIDWHWTHSKELGSLRRFFSREVTIRGCNLVEGGEGEGSSGHLLLPNNILDFNIIECNGLTSLSNISSSLKNATQLKRCSIEDCDQMENFWSFSISLLEEEEQGSEGYSNSDTPIRESLMTLNLQMLPNLSVIFKFNGVGAPPPPKYCGIFSNLKLLCVSFCHKLKYLFPRGLVQHHLQNLEVIHVMYCNEMKKIIHEDKEEEEETAESNFHYNDSDYIITFPKLHTLALGELPKLKSIWSGTLVCHSLQQIGIDRCPLLNRLPFSAHLLNNNVDAQASPSTVPNLRKIHGEPMEWRDSLKWDHPDTKSTLDPLFGTYWTIFSTFDEEDQLSRKDEERYEMILIKEPSILQELQTC